MDMIKLQKMVREQAERHKNKESLYNQKAILSSAIGEYASHKAKAETTTLNIFPLVLQLPFNPLDPSATDFNSLNPFTFACSPTSAVEILKQAMLDNKELHETYARFINLTSETYELVMGEITADDIKIFSQFREVNQLSVLTQKITKL